MIGDNADYDISVDFKDNYKSCFARSVAVNSQYKQTKTPDLQQLQSEVHTKIQEDPIRKITTTTTASPKEFNETVRLRKNTRSCLMDETRQLTTSLRRKSFCSSRIADLPVENIVQQSRVETLQWQLKEIEKSREMYRAVMKQVVTFLEKAHHSLELFSKRFNAKSTVSRSKSEHRIEGTPDKSATLSSMDDTISLLDTTWRGPKKLELLPDEVAPEKLSQEAFRLLRTVQSLLNTQEPKLSETNNETSDDFEFLSQLAKEFPQNKPQRTTSFSLSPKLILPENDVKLTTIFNRKLSLQLSESRRSSYRMIERKSEDYCPKPKFITESEKSNSPGAGSVSSIEDESGFSSMNSFQDVGLPLVNSTTCEEVTAKNVLLKSMLHNDVDTLGKLPIGLTKEEKLWQKSDVPVHKRWSSTPVETGGASTKQSMKVLWV